MLKALWFRLLESTSLSRLWFQIDSNLRHYEEVIDAGANAIVAGSAVFNSDDYAAAIAGIKASKAPK